MDDNGEHTDNTDIVVTKDTDEKQIFTIIFC